MTTALSAPLSRAELGAFVLRIALGSMFVSHALLKYFVFTLPGTAQFFGSLGLPPFLGYVTFFAELVGGVLLLLGVYTRQVALALVPILVGATWAHAGNGWLFSAPNGGLEYPAFLTVAAFVQFLIGDGAFALRRSESSGRGSAISTATASA
jgi:putative oxidoreductase